MDTPSVPPPVIHPVRRSRVALGCAAALVLLLVILTTVGITVWWLQRPIKPVTLDQQEWKVLEDKLKHFEHTSPQTPATGQPAPTVSDDTGNPPVQVNRPYTPGDKVLRISERELNALLNKNTELGENLRFELDKDAVNAYLVMPIPKDFPLGGGSTLRARGRFTITIGNGKTPQAILEDVTVFGLSLPKAWLGGIKGENLFGNALGTSNGKPLLEGVKSLAIEPGNLVIEVAD